MSFLIGILLGLIQTGAQTARTIEVMRGHVLNTLLTCIVMNITWWYSTHLVVNNDLTGFFGMCLGAIVVTTAMAYWNKRDQQDKSTGP
jgi:uncharacterized membrane protein AbrB (regulator of aidB expression)